MNIEGIKVLNVKVLVVDDNQEDINMVRDFLSTKGYEILEARSGEQALLKVKQMKPDLVVLDWLLPGMQGVDICKEIKTTTPNMPVLMLSVHKSAEHKVKAFHHGCDDYVSKPCELEELEIRIQNLLKRSSVITTKKMFKLGDIEVDVLAHRVTKAGQFVDLTVKEYCLLEFLMINSGKVVTRNMILEQVWGADSETFTNIVDVYVNYLRKKVDPPKGDTYIKTIRGIGYMMEDPHSKQKAA